MGTKIRDKLFQIVKSFCALDKPAFIMENICLGFAYIIMHVHQEWPTLINDLVNSLSNTQSEVISLLKIVDFMASEADDDNVVIEESLREQFFDFLDANSPAVFNQILNQWSAKIQ